MASGKYSRKSRTTRELDESISAANSFEQWWELAEAYDRHTGGDVWRATDESPLYDAASITTRLQRLRRLRKKGDDHGLLFALNEGIHGNMADRP
jgi:TAG lipase / steryl ester hydrolase / phospholipase A2 / LPA acyltransferase